MNTLQSISPGLVEFVGGAEPTSNENLAELTARANGLRADFFHDVATEAANDFDVTLVQRASANPAPRPAASPLRPVEMAKTGEDRERETRIGAMEIPKVPSQPAPMPPTTGLVSKLKAEFAADIRKVKAAETALTDLQRSFDSDGLAPGSAARRIEDLEKSIRPDTDAPGLRKIADEIARLRGISQPLILQATRIVGEQNEKVRALSAALCDKVSARLSELLAEARDAEAMFFRAHDLPHSETAVALRAKNLASQISLARKQLRSIKEIEADGDLHTAPFFHPNDPGVFSKNPAGAIGFLLR